MQRATVKKLKLTIAWPTESQAHGVLSSLTSSSHYGLLDANALLQATSSSVLGRWWAQHRGLLVQAIVQLDAHTFAIAPSLSVAVLRRYGPGEVVEALTTLGIGSKSPADVVDYLQRSDLGRHLLGQIRSVGETRGNPAEDAGAAFALLGREVGFGGAKDKALNKSFAEAIQVLLTGHDESGEVPSIRAETSLSFAPLTPDNSIEYGDVVHCVEYAWRQGDYISTSKRATIAEYILKKLQSYSREMGWVGAGE